MCYQWTSGCKELFFCCCCLKPFDILSYFRTIICMFPYRLNITCLVVCFHPFLANMFCLLCISAIYLCPDWSCLTVDWLSYMQSTATSQSDVCAYTLLVLLCKRCPMKSFVRLKRWSVKLNLLGAIREVYWIFLLCCCYLTMCQLKA